MSGTDFSAIRRRAESRKGGAAALHTRCAMSIGDDYDADIILQRTHGDE